MKIHSFHESTPDDAEKLIKLVEKLTESISMILPAREILSRCRLISGFSHEVIGHSENNAAIDFYKIGNGGHSVLFYGFPDPGEAIGAAGILALMQALSDPESALHNLDVTWLFIPCLNFDDQPDGGNSLKKIMKTSAQEVDWMVHNPRPETTALLGVLKQYRPLFVFPMHDEFHCKELKPVYFPVSHPQPEWLAEKIRRLVRQAGFAIDASFNHKQMGEGFFIIEEEAGEEFSSCTWSVAQQNGFVFICELFDAPGMPHRKIVATQLAAGLSVLAALIAAR
ncbi:MAG: hypothetical protein GQF41_4109 [Candidatus Rifleibacterium amylolyticum]|nr:MAG: hypothetical protein GQF41_4109 [Candidatus Rifleibacterium amylolyticum]